GGGGGDRSSLPIGNVRRRPTSTTGGQDRTTSLTSQAPTMGMYQRHLSVCATLILAVSALHAQPADTVAAHYATVITVEDLREHLTIIASDEYEGRDTGKEGQKKAAAYLRDQFISYGIPPIEGASPEAIVEGYYQPVE